MALAQSDKPLVLVTGSSGLIGARTVADLVRDHRVVGLDAADPRGRLPDGARFIRCDVTSDEQVQAALDRVEREHGAHVASVVHMAAYYDFSGAPSPLYEQLTVEGTRRLLRELQRLTVDQLVFTSTLLVMKPAEPGEVITESSPIEGAWDYPRSKIAAEDVIRAERGAIPAVILRLAGAYDERGHSPPLTQQIYRIYERKLESHLFPGDPDRGQPFVHLDDIVSAIRKTIERRGALGGYEVFLIAEPEIVSYGRLQDRLGALVHGDGEWTTLRVPAPLAKAGAWIKDKLTPDDAFIKPWMIDLADAHYPVSCERARALLGWQPRHRLDDTLPDMVRALRRDPGAFYDDNDLPR